MTKVQKQNLFKGVLVAVGGFALWVIVFLNLKITEATSEFVVKQNAWVTKFVENILTYHVFYLIIAAVLVVGFYLIRNPKRQKK